MSRFNRSLFVLALMIALGGTFAAGQIPPGPEGPEEGKGRPQGRMGPPSPEERAKMQRFNALRTTAEAYKSLADLYADQGKTDEAVAELKKILDLTSSVEGNEVPKLNEHIGHVYMEITEIYLRKNRLSDAEATLNEGLPKFKDNPEIATRIYLQLGNIYKKSGKTQEAENMFKKVIELNASAISSSGKK